MAVKTAKEELLSMRDASRLDIIPDNIKDSVQNIIEAYSRFTSSETQLSRDANKGLLLNLVQELLILPDSKHLKREEIQARLELIRPTLKFMQSVLASQLKKENEYTQSLKEKVYELEQKKGFLEQRALYFKKSS